MRLNEVHKQTNVVTLHDVYDFFNVSFGVDKTQSYIYTVDMNEIGKIEMIF